MSMLAKLAGIQCRTQEQAQQAEHLKRIETQVLLADRVITTLSNYAKMPVPDLRPVDVRRVAEEAAAESALPATVRVVQEWPDGLSQALADPDQLRIVLSNLVRNARDAMPEGGTLTLSGRAAEGHIEVAVADTGVGIPPDQLGRVTEPLYTTKARGLGLGLALARAIVEKNRGDLHVISQLGVGSTFTVRLPLAPQQRANR
jgi:signal transduction histidine kinase